MTATWGEFLVAIYRLEDMAYKDEGRVTMHGAQQCRFKKTLVAITRISIPSRAVEYVCQHSPFEALGCAQQHIIIYYFYSQSSLSELFYIRARPKCRSTKVGGTTLTTVPLEGRYCSSGRETFHREMLATKLSRAGRVMPCCSLVLRNSAPSQYRLS